MTGENKGFRRISEAFSFFIPNYKWHRNVPLLQQNASYHFCKKSWQKKLMFYSCYICIHCRAIYAYFLETFLYIGIFHKEFPNQTGTVILDHQKCNTFIYANYTWGIPVRCYIQVISICKTIPAP